MASNEDPARITLTQLAVLRADTETVWLSRNLEKHFSDQFFFSFEMGSWVIHVQKMRVGKHGVTLVW